MINDEFAGLKISKQQRWALRNPDKVKQINRRYESSPERKKAKREWARHNKKTSSD